jgi:hypothetical protein
VVCLRPDGTPGGRLLELPGEEAVCEERSGGVHPPDGTYDRFVKEHAVWTRENMSFVREIAGRPSSPKPTSSITGSATASNPAPSPALREKVFSLPRPPPQAEAFITQMVRTYPDSTQGI